MSKLPQAASFLFIAFLAGCQAAQPPPFDPRAMGQGERQSARDVSKFQMRPLPTALDNTFSMGSQRGSTSQPSSGPSLGAEPQVRLTLQEIVHRAVANSNDIKVAAYQPAIDQTRVIEAEARFDPVFFTNFQLQHTNILTPFPSAQAPTGRQQETNNSFQIGLKQNLESGGQVEIRAQTAALYNDVLNRTTLNPNAFGQNPAIQNDFVLQITQPLLRDFGNEVNRARIVINRNNQRISLLDFRKQIEDTIADIEKVYWSLVLAERNVKIQEDLVSETIDTGLRLVSRRGTDVTSVQISQTNSELQSRRANLVDAKTQLKNLSQQLKRDMNDPDLPVSGPTIIMPAAPPLEDAVQFDQADAIQTALANRLELGQQQIRVSSADTALAVGKNNLQPQLNAIGSVSFSGLDHYEYGAMKQQFDGQNFSYAVGIELEVPIGNREARATYQRALMQRQQASAAYAAQIATVTFEVTTSLNEVRSAWEQLGNNRQAVLASENALRGLEQREAAGGDLSPEFVQLKLDQQQRVAQARRDEASSMASYNQSIGRVEQAQGTLLQYSNIVMEQDALPYERKLMQGSVR